MQITPAVNKEPVSNANEKKKSNPSLQIFYGLFLTIIG